ncbi:MAG: DUF1501 domain-containing protein, partial [Planctomycetales bacterium]|nr:DUF1501 domain-containing protein [Planctomycetales bacterium]
MFRIACDSTASRRAPYCDGVSRRSFLQIGMAGIGSLGLADILRAKEASAAATASAMGKAAGGKKNTSVILLWLDGGPSHIDTYDMKPEAPAEYRGIWSPIKSNVP